MSDKVLLFAHPRSGSSSLFQILDLQPELRILEEPFNENYVKWKPGNKNYRDLIRDRESLDAQLDEILAQYDGLKVLNYQLGDELSRCLLMRKDLRIIFLRRRNLLQTAVSDRIAHQTNLWKRWNMVGPLANYYRNLKPLDVTDIRCYITGMKRQMDHFESVVDGRSADRVFKIEYERLYLSSFVDQTKQLDALFGFLELAPIRSERINYYLRPESAKLNSNATYAYLSNSCEIDLQCGCDETGWLFEVRRSV